MSRIQQWAAAVVRSAFLWGGLGSVGFFMLIHTGTLKGEFFYRYFAGHWVNYTETILFFFGLALLILRSCDLADQKFLLKKKSFDAGLPVPDAAAESRTLIEQLDKLPRNERQHYLPRRLREALEGILRNGSADTLETDLRYLSEVDGMRSHAGYAMVRLIIWAIPILGFLGTVIGITIAIAALDPKLLEKSMDTVTAGLGVAFDTTALALALSMGLMFLQYFVDKQEQRLLADVDAKTFDMLVPRFPVIGSVDDPETKALRRMADAVIGTVDRSVAKQIELWRESIGASEQRWLDATTAVDERWKLASDDVDRRWREMTTATEERWKEISTVGREVLEESFGRAVSRSMETHRKHLLATEEAAAEQTHKRWLGVQQALEACVSTSRSQQGELTRQAEALVRVVEATGHVRQLEDALNRNLTSLVSSQHLQETLMNLSAAVNLLNARLERIAPAVPYLGTTPTSSKAA